MTRLPRLLLVLAALFAALGVSVASASSPNDVKLPVPQRSQLDGTIWADSNCGPASLAMILEAFGDRTTNLSIRQRANQLLGISSPGTGTKIEHLAAIAREHGLSVNGPMQGADYRRWTLDETRAELKQGRPLLIQVWFPSLPNHKNNPVPTDHFIVLTGTGGDAFVYNDPADSRGTGYQLTMTADQLTRAWRSSGAPYAAISVGPGTAGKSLLPPPPPPPAESIAAAPTPEAAPAPMPIVAEVDPTPAGGEVLATAPEVPKGAGDLGQVVSPVPDAPPEREEGVPMVPLAGGLILVMLAGAKLFQPERC